MSERGIDNPLQTFMTKAYYFHYCRNVTYMYANTTIIMVTASTTAKTGGLHTGPQ